LSLENPRQKKSHEDILFFSKEWTFMAVLMFFMLFVLPPGGRSFRFTATSAAVIGHGMYQAFTKKTRIFDRKHACA
jgi:hypothetical protein